MSLSVLLLELDTISDLTDYLDKKAKLIQGGHLVGAHGEEDLLAVYSKDVNEHGQHDFVHKSRRSLRANEKLIIESGSYNYLRTRKEYKRKKAADKVSYAWDRLIERFAVHVLAGDSYVVPGFEDFHDPFRREIGLRYMALQGRLERRSHALAIRGAFEKIGSRDRMFRAMLPGPNSPDQSTGFFILLVKRHSFLANQTDDQYRQIRGGLLHAYAMNLLLRTPTLKRVIGIATEGEPNLTRRSEDMLYAEQPLWTPEYEAEIREIAEKVSIFRDGTTSPANLFHMNPQEYPPSHHPEASGANPIPYPFMPDRDEMAGNRAARRALRAKGRRNAR